MCTHQKDTGDQWHASSDKPLHSVYVTLFGIFSQCTVCLWVHHVGQTRIKSAGVTEHASSGSQQSLSLESVIVGLRRPYLFGLCFCVCVCVCVLFAHNQ